MSQGKLVFHVCKNRECGCRKACFGQNNSVVYIIHAFSLLFLEPSVREDEGFVQTKQTCIVLVSSRLQKLQEMSVWVYRGIRHR